MNGVVAAGIVAHVPTLSRAEITPDYQRTLVDGERRLGERLRALSADVWIVISTHWVSTFNWFTTCQPVHEGVCVADEAPDLIPGIAYRYNGDAEFARALVEAWKDAGIPAVRNESPNYAWDYGTYVPLAHLDPDAKVPVVGVPVVLMSDVNECLRAGAAIHETAKRLGRQAVVLASSALSHALVRGREHWPTPERIDSDRRMIELLKRGDLAIAIEQFPDYARATVAEMGGRAIATMLGAAKALADDGGTLSGVQFGEYAQSSGSGNANLVVSRSENMAMLS